MDEKTIRSILQDALEDEIPPAEIRLWPAVKHFFTEGLDDQKGVAEMRGSILRWVPRVVVLTALVLSALVVVTPQGRSLAQGLLLFFAPAEEASFPLTDSQMASAPEEESPTAEAPVPLITVAEAEEQVGFDAAELSFVPTGLTYLGVRVRGDTINIEYETPGHGSHLIIAQSQDGYRESDWDSVPRDHIVPVTIGDLTGEFVQGTFVVYPEDTFATWNPDAAILRLRWQADGTWFEIAKYGSVEAVEYIDQDELIALAEDLMGQ